MTTCKQCGKDNQGEASFCMFCGATMTVRVGGPGSAEGTGGAGGAGGDTDKTTPATGRRMTIENLLLEPLRDVTLGHYEILEEIGRGGMAVVFLAHDLALDRKVAIKVIPPNLLDAGQELRERFKREARTVASLSHPHIIPIHAVRENEDLLFIVMKYVEGRNLESVMRDVGPLPLGMVDTILRQVGGALGYGHRHGVVHRDIKPANVMLDEEGWAVVTDFGIAKAAESEALTLTGGTVGTPGYMSPEQCLGLPITGASDQYSLGIVAYEMLTNSVPFVSESAMTLMYKHCHEPPPRLNTVLPSCPRPLAAAVARMLRKEPADRWPTLEDMITSLGDAHETEADSVRSQMVTLAKRPSAQRIVDKFNTPQSPVPPGRTAQIASVPTPATGDPTSAAPQTSQTEVKRRRLPAWWPVPLVFAALGALLVWSPWTSSPEQSPPQPIDTPAAGGLATLEVGPTPATLFVGDTARLTVLARNAAGETIDTAILAWQSSDAAVARVSESGLVTALGAGSVDISAASGAQSTTVHMDVTPAPVAPVTTPEPPTRRTPVRVATLAITNAPSTLEPGDTVRLQITLQDASGATVQDRPVTWTSNDAQIARVASGIVTAVAAGAATITAASDGQSASVTLTVRPVAVASVTVSPRSDSVSTGGSVRLTAAARDRNGSVLAGRLVTWRSRDPAVANVSAAGVVSALTPGTTVISASIGGQSATAQITVAAVAPDPVPAVDPRPDIDAVIQTYARAIQSEDIDELERAYPGMTPRQRADWQTFFRGARDLRVNLTVEAMEIVGDTATAMINARYEFRSTQQQVATPTLRATLARTAGVWRLIEVDQIAQNR